MSNEQFMNKLSNILIIKRRLQIIQLFLTFNLLLLTFNCFSLGTAINTTGAAAHNSAMLDISATGKGLLIPRMSTSNRPVNAS